MKKRGTVALVLFAILMIAIIALLIHQHSGSSVTGPTAAAPEVLLTASQFNGGERVIPAVHTRPPTNNGVRRAVATAPHPTSPAVDNGQPVDPVAVRSTRSADGLASPILVPTLAKRFNAAPGSKVRIEGTSTAHDWQAQSPIIAGFIEVGANFPSEPGQNITPGKVDVRGKAEVTVSSLMSVEKNGQKYSDKMDDKMHEMLQEPFFPKIVFDLRNLTLTPSITNEIGDYVFDSIGNLAVAGVTNTIEFPVTMGFLPDNKIRLSGSVPLKMSQFKITPESILFVKTADDVLIKFEWVLRLAKPALATNAAGFR